MSESARSVRRSTQAELARVREQASREIRTLQENHRRDIARLQEERDRQLADYGRKLKDLEVRQQAALRAAEQQVNAQLEQQKKAIREQMDALQKQTEQKLLEQKKLFEQMLKRLYDEIDRRVSEVMARMDKLEENEQSLAEEEVRAAKDKLLEIAEDEDVKTFQGDILELILRPLVNGAISQLNAGNWPAATSKAIVALTECKRIELEAKEERKEWEARKAVVAGKLEELKAGLAVLEREDTRIAFAGKKWRGTLRIWNPDEFKALSDLLARQEEALREVKPGRHDELDTLDVELTSLKYTGRIDTAVQYAERGVHAYIIAYRILLGLIKVAAMDWSVEEGGELEMKQPESEGSVILINDENDELVAEVSVISKKLDQGYVSFRLTVSCRGNRNNGALAAVLDAVIADLKEELNGSDYGFLITVASNRFTDNKGFPAVSVTLERNTVSDPLIGVGSAAPEASAPEARSTDTGTQASAEQPGRESTQT